MAINISIEVEKRTSEVDPNVKTAFSFLWCVPVSKRNFIWQIHGLLNSSEEIRKINLSVYWEQICRGLCLAIQTLFFAGASVRTQRRNGAQNPQAVPLH